MLDRKFRRTQLSSKDRNLLSIAEQRYWRSKGEYLRVLEWSMHAYATYEDKQLNDDTIKTYIAKIFAVYNKDYTFLYKLIENLNTRYRSIA